uniref:ENT domain-containing protein n=1 Tax=Panagrellus redivivus TaxID=6233 RepID=A0A7E4ULZ4_PANRE
MLDKSVPHAELEAEKARLAELIDNLQRENDGLHHTLATVLPEEETDTILESKGLSDVKTLAKLRNEAAARRQEVEHYQNLLTTLIRDKTPLPVYSESRPIESPEVSKKSNPQTKKRHSSKSKHGLPPITVASPASSKLESAPNGGVVDERQPDEYVVNGVESKVSTTESAPSAETPKPIQNKDKEKVLQVVANQNNVEQLTTTSDMNSKKPKQYNKEFHKLKTIKEVPISPSLPSPSLLMSPPVKMVNSPLRYVELSSPEISPRIDTPPEHLQPLHNFPHHKLSHGTQGIHTPQLERNFKEFDSDAADTDSNIGAIAAEYRERDMDERVDLLVIALKCQLLREEMLQTRVMSF